MSTTQKVQDVRAALSAARMSTYDLAVAHAADPSAASLDLYAWNAQISGALLTPLHICEVVIRNAVSEVLERVYGPMWPWSATFERSLPRSHYGYQPVNDLRSGRNGQTTTGKVIAELKFVFWQKMFTGRYDLRLWDHHGKSVFPNAPPAMPVAVLRSRIHSELEHLRNLRNRIAHHEPIFSRNLAGDLGRMEDLVQLRCNITAEWMMQHQQAAALNRIRP